MRTWSTLYCKNAVQLSIFSVHLIFHRRFYIYFGEVTNYVYFLETKGLIQISSIVLRQHSHQLKQTYWGSIGPATPMFCEVKLLFLECSLLDLKRAQMDITAPVFH